METSKNQPQKASNIWEKWRCHKQTHQILRNMEPLKLQTSGTHGDLNHLILRNQNHAMREHED
jgi:hypothetical protein